uniref:Uncharacterized protein n=1 Tax=Hyaloperonospora arabidopsidis (strain Emoy2) TaxID=559515 RepID=M4BKG6_HYAAE
MRGPKESWGSRLVFRSDCSSRTASFTAIASWYRTTGEVKRLHIHLMRAMD